MRDSVETKPWSGRPTKISATSAGKIVRDAKKIPQIIKNNSEKSGVAVSRYTIRRQERKEKWAVWYPQKEDGQTL